MSSSNFGGKSGIPEAIVQPRCFEADDESRYPPLRVTPDRWCRPKPPAQPQFERAAPPCGLKADPPFTYSGANLAACDFPIGGFGAGNVILHGDGTLQGWTVVNQVRSETLPMHDIPACFFGITADDHSFVLASPETYTEEACALPPNKAARVTQASVRRMQALPGVKSLTLTGTFPIADVDYAIDGFPLQVAMEATSPMIPGDIKNSALPAALFTFTLTNPGSAAVSVRLLAAQQNFVGWDGQKDCTAAAGTTPFWGSNVNTPYASGTSAGLRMSSAALAPTDAYNGTVNVAAVLKPADAGLPAAASAAAKRGFGASSAATPTVTVLPQAASEEELWAAFVAKTSDADPATAAPTPPSAAGTAPVGGVVQSVSVPPGQSVTLTFCTSWHFANRQRNSSCGGGYAGILPEVLGNRYAAWFADAGAVADYTIGQLTYLLQTTRLYRDTMFATTMPPELLDSAAGRAAVMRCGTMWWTRDGTVMGTEGNGCCPLNCTHVYGYTTLMERLYPDVAKDMRISDFVRNYDDAAGGCTMRFGRGGWAIDGAFACIIKAYLVVQQADSQLSFLPMVWQNVKAQMDQIQAKFDVDGDGVIRAAQQNTYDTAMMGANTFIGSYYVCALRAMAAMATLMGETALAASYTARAKMSAANYEKICWNDSFGYYIADVTAKDCANSYGPGCFVDQLCGTGLAGACGFGHLFNPAHEAAARKAVLKYNIVTKPPWNDMQKHLEDGDTAITVCQYPNGKLGGGMRYDSLVSTGFTSPNIAGMMLDRNVDGACTIAKNIRTRQDGRNRSPWNEPECNVLYSRAMAHWNIFDQGAGFKWDSTKGALAYDPRTSVGAFRCFTILEGGWGMYAQQGPESATANAGLASGSATLSCLWGSMRLTSLGLATTATTATATVDGQPISTSSFAGGVLTFAKPLTLASGSVLAVALHGGVARAGGVAGSVGLLQVPAALRQRHAASAVADDSARLLQRESQPAEMTPSAGLASRHCADAGACRTLALLIIAAIAIFAAGVATAVAFKS